MREDDRNEVKSYLEEVELMVVASVNDKKPWVATVFYCYDDELNLYFLSRLMRRHSQDIIRNPNVAVAIAGRKFKFGDRVEGLQIEGICTSLSGDEARNAFGILKKRFPKAKQVIQEDTLTRYLESFSKEEIIHRIWKIKLTKIKIFDETKYGDIGKEIDFDN